MRTLLSVLATAVAVWSTSADGAADICKSAAFKAIKATPLGSSPLNVRALVVKDEVCMEFELASTAPADTTWIAVGLTPSGSMVSTPEANCMIYMKPTNKLESYVIGGYSSSAVTREPDQTFFTVAETSTTGTLKFSYQRKLAQTSKYDVVIDPAVAATFIWAYGSSWPISGHKPGSKGIESYNFATGVSTTTKEPFCDEYNCPAVIGGSAFALMVLGGFLFNIVLKKTPIGRAMLLKTLAAPPVMSTTNAPVATPGNMFMQNLADLRLGEVLVIIIYVAAIVVMVLMNSKSQNVVTTGRIVTMVMMFMILPITKIPLWTGVFGTSFERVVKFHRWLGMLVTVITIVHFIMALSRISGPTDTNKVGNVTPLFGFIAMISFVLLGFTANEVMRRKLFDVFYGFHRVCSIVGFVGCILHAPKIVGPALVVPLALYVLGNLVQWINQYSTKYEAIVEVNEDTLTTTLVLTSTNKTKKWAQTMNPCSYFWVQVATVSGTQWHPFSAIVTPNGDSIAFCVRKMAGHSSFTGQLLQQGKLAHSMAVRLSGPYGKITVDLDDYDVVVLIGGGVGLTPLLSAVNQRRLFAPKTAKAADWNVLWSVRYPTDLLMMDQLMPSRGQLDYVSSTSSNIQDAYHPMMSSAALNTSWYCHVSEEANDGFVTRANGEQMPYRGGMPVLDEYINTSRYVGRKVAVLACGPPTMTVEAQDLARRCGFDFHKEVFNW